MPAKAGKLPTVAQCVEYIESCGWKCRGKDVLRRRVFRNPNITDASVAAGKTREFSVNLTEMRDMYRSGF